MLPKSSCIHIENMNSEYVDRILMRSTDFLDAVDEFFLSENAFLLVNGFELLPCSY